MTEEEYADLVDRALLVQYAAEYAWYMHRAFTGEIGKDVFSVVPNSA